MPSSACSRTAPPKPYRVPVLVVVVAAVAVVMLLPTSLPGATAHSAATPPSPEAGSSSPATVPAEFWENLSANVGSGPWDRSQAQAAYSPTLGGTILFGGYNGAGGNFALNDTWEYSGGTWNSIATGVTPPARWGGTMVYDPAEQALVLFGGRNVTQFFNDTWVFNATGWHQLATPVAPSPRYDFGLAYDPLLGAVVLYGGAIGNLPAGTFANFTFYTDTWTFEHGAWHNVTAAVGAGPPGRLLRGQMVYDAADGYLLLTGGSEFRPPANASSCPLFQFDPTWGATWTFSGTTWSALTTTGAPPAGSGVLWFDSETNQTLYYLGMEGASGSDCGIAAGAVYAYSAGTWSLLWSQTDASATAPVDRILPVVVDDPLDDQQLLFGGQLSATASTSFGVYTADTWAFFPAGNAPTPPLPTNSSWTNITGTVAPSDRSLSQAAYDPALGATVLFGGYYGVGANYPLGDTWEFVGNAWTELGYVPPAAPAPRWGATMVYDPVLQSLVLFGGRDANQMFDDTWEFNATGWHQVPTATAPSPRYDYGLAYDPGLGAVVLYGGAIGNVPAGTFENFVYYADTWTFQNGTWTNITASAGPGPTGRLLRGQMTYDAADGYVLIAGGYTYVPLGNETACGYVVFNPAWAATWTFTGGRWSQLVGAYSSPPDGDGVLWFDAQANETLYYVGMWLNASGNCDVSGDMVWSFSGGAWTLVTEGTVLAPAPREQTVVIDDLADDEQIVFGGELGATASEYYAAYLNDTWTYQPTWMTFVQQGVPAGARWHVSVGGVAQSSSGGPILFVEAPGAYAYSATVTASGAYLAGDLGTVRLSDGPRVVRLTYDLPGPSPGPTGHGGLAALAGLAAPLAAGAAVGIAGIAGWAAVGLARERSRLRREGEDLVDALRADAPPRAPRP